MNYTIKRLSDYSEENLLKEVKRVAKELGKNTLAMKEFERHARVGASVVTNKCGGGSWNVVLEKAGLLVQRRRNIPDEELLAEIERLWKKLRRQPDRREMDKLGKFSVGPYKRFGGWIGALEEFSKWKNKTDSFEDLEKDNSDILPDQKRKKVDRTRKKVVYGKPIDFLGLRHAPLNEQGVVYLFGKLSEQLGFIIEAVRQMFPDCEGKREIPGKPGVWEKVSIEFEHKSSEFKKHGHKTDECDIIICWENDWEDCPIEVISLKEKMEEIKSKYG